MYTYVLSLLYSLTPIHPSRPSQNSESRFKISSFILSLSLCLPLSGTYCLCCVQTRFARIVKHAFSFYYVFNNLYNLSNLLIKLLNGPSIYVGS